MRGDVLAAVQKGSALERKARMKEQDEKREKQKSKKTSANPKDSSKVSKEDLTAVTGHSNPSKKQSVPDTTSTIDKTQSSKQEKSTSKPTDFQTIASSAPRRLNDIVQAPPELKKLPRGAAKLKAARLAQGAGSSPDGRTLRQGALSMAQKAMMEEERERAVRMYREMRKRKGD